MSECKQRCAEEFKISNFLLTHANPELFVTSQWTRGHWPLIYVIYRVVIAVYFSVWIVLSEALTFDWITSKDPHVKWLIFLTNWGFSSLVLDVIVEAAIASYGYWKIRRIGSREAAFPVMTWYMKAEWVLYNVATGVGLVVSVTSWIFVHQLAPSNYTLHPVDVHTHVVNFSYIIINLFITGVPVRVYHAYHSLTVVLVYIFFSLAYQKAGGTNNTDHPYIYSFLDWNKNPTQSALYSFIVVTVLGLVIWPIVYVLCLIRRAIHRGESETEESRALVDRTSGERCDRNDPRNASS